MVAALFFPAGASATVGTNTDVAFQTINPAVTDAGVSADLVANAQHHVWAPPAAERRPALVVFLPGSGQDPGDYQQFGRMTANAGFDTIGLSYDNATTIQSACLAPQTDAEHDSCLTDVRGTAIFGSGSGYGRSSGTLASGTPLANTTLPNSVVNRLVALLRQLGWDRYLAPAAGSPYGKAGQPAYPVWSKIVIAGHSQGADQALFTSKRIDVRRVVALSGPTDALRSGPPSWCGRPRRPRRATSSRCATRARECTATTARRTGPRQECPAPSTARWRR